MDFLKSNRWFIWALVSLLVAGVCLVTYIFYFGTADDYWAVGDFTIIHRHRVLNDNLKCSVVNGKRLCVNTYTK